MPNLVDIVSSFHFQLLAIFLTLTNAYLNWRKGHRDRLSRVSLTLSVLIALALFLGIGFTGWQSRIDSKIFQEENTLGTIASRHQNLINRKLQLQMDRVARESAETYFVRTNGTLLEGVHSSSGKLLGNIVLKPIGNKRIPAFNFMVYCKNAIIADADPKGASFIRKFGRGREPSRRIGFTLSDIPPTVQVVEIEFTRAPMLGECDAEFFPNKSRVWRYW